MNSELEDLIKNLMGSYKTVAVRAYVTDEGNPKFKLILHKIEGQIKETIIKTDTIPQLLKKARPFMSVAEDEEEDDL